LQVLEDGRLTDGQGRTVDFRNTVIVMTSNLGSQLIQEMSGQAYESMKSEVMEIVRQYFQPEFINRIDDVVVFHPLTQAQIRAIANFQIAILQARLQAMRIDLVVNEETLDHLGAIGFDPVYGARPLKRVMQRLLENPLAQAILAGHFSDGDTIEVAWENDAPVFKSTLEKKESDTKA
jgi:ATP-dependent Clp protease ATP-binding subunit ClpB